MVLRVRVKVRVGVRDGRRNVATAEVANTCSQGSENKGCVDLASAQGVSEGSKSEIEGGKSEGVLWSGRAAPTCATC